MANRTISIGVTLLTTACASQAFAQWSYAVLNPAGAPWAYAEAVRDGQIVGRARFGDVEANYQAGVWDLASLNWTQLSSVGTSDASGVSGEFLVGKTHAPFSEDRAALWTGAAHDYVDLQPVGYGPSFANAASANQQVGAARYGSGIPSYSHAGLWTGSASSWVDLHPSGLGNSESEALGVSGDQQVGYVAGYAAMWSGSASSFVNLSPAGSIKSKAYAVSEGRQGGEALFPGTRHAGLWSGSSESWLDLHPAGARQSSVYAMDGAFQAGYVWFDSGSPHATVWSGTQGSVEDLQAGMPAEWGITHAHGVWSDGSTLYVVGQGGRSGVEGVYAVVWSRPIPTPGTLGLFAVAAIAVGRRRR